MNTSTAKRITVALTVLSFLFVTMVGFSTPGKARAAGVYSVTNASANLLTNADMEGGTTNWVIWGSGTLSSDTSQFHGGAKSVKLSGRTANWNGVGQNVAVSNFPTSGQNYTVSIWVRSESGTPTAKATLKLTASTTTYVTLASAAINSSGWTLLSGTVPVSWSGTLTGVLFYVETAAGTDNLYIDDASFTSAGSFPVAGTYYQFINRNSGKVAEVAANSTADGGNVQQWTWAGTNNQQWSFVAQAGGYYEIINRNSGKVLEVAGSSTTDGGNVQQWTWAGTNNQQWSLVDLGTGYYELVNRNSGKALDVVNNGTADGVNIDQWTWNSGNNQQWTITVAGAGPTATPTKTPTPGPGGVVSTYGRLQISNAQLKASNGTAIQLAGMSSHGLTWFPLIDLNVNNATNQNTLKQQITFNPAGGTPFPYTSSAVTNLVNQWHIQVIRTTMFPYDPWNGVDAKSYDNNYPTWKWYNINLVNAIVQSAINKNIYVIIDWHAGEGNDQDPNIYWNNGHVQEFFTYMVDKWGSYPNVIYETVNSPVISWAGSPGLKSYNQNVINFIRARENTDGYANDNLIIAGTPTWSQDVDVATNDPLTGNMIAYNYMWYAGTHFSWVQSRGDTALANLATKAPNQILFMGEVGTSTSDGNGGVYYSNFNTLMEWAKTRKLSWLNWSIANKNESSAIFVPAIPGNIPNNEIAWRGGDGGSIAQAMASTGYAMRMGPWATADYSCTGKFMQGWMLYNTSQAVPSGC